MNKWTRGYMREEPMPVKIELREITELLDVVHFPNDENIVYKRSLLQRYLASYCSVVAPGACRDFSPFSHYSKPVYGPDGGEVECEAPDETAISCSSECAHTACRPSCV